MKSAQTVYCMPGGGMTIGSVSKNESVKVFWSDSSYYYIEYVVSSGNYSGYKRGYVPISSVNTGSQTIPSQGFTSFLAKTSASKTVYNRSNTSSMVIGTVYASDKITVLNVENNTWCYIQYPVGSSSYKRGYVLKSDIVSAEGNLEAISFSRIVGWAWNPAAPDTSIYVQIKIHNNSTGQDTTDTVCANIYRLDLLQAGKGNGYHGFGYIIDWSNYPSGTYTVTATALSGFNPQVGTSLTYNTNDLKATYYVTLRPWPDEINSGVLNIINQSISLYTSLGFSDGFLTLYGPSHTTPYYEDNASSAIALASPQLFSVTAYLGHGFPGGLRLLRSTGEERLLSYTPSNNYPYTWSSFNDLGSTALAKADIVAFLACQSDVAPNIEGGRSLARIAVDKGAKFSIGFNHEVSNAFAFYYTFLYSLHHDQCNCQVAFDTAKEIAYNDYLVNQGTCNYGTSGLYATCYRRCMI